MAERQHLGAEGGVGPAANDQDVKEEPPDGIDEGVEHDRERGRGPGWPGLSGAVRRFPLLR